MKTMNESAKNKETAPVITGVATPEQIVAWKIQHGEVHEVVVEDKVCYLKRPDRSVISMAVTLGKSDPLKYSAIVLENCWLGGDELIKSDDSYFLGVSGTMGELLKAKTATIKKL